VPARGWPALVYQWSRDVQLWLYITASLVLFRLLLIGVFFDQAMDANLPDLLAVNFTGLRFDISTAGVWIAPLFLGGLLCTVLPCGALLTRLRRWLAYGYVTVGLLLLGADLIYFYEYGDQYNQRIFGLFLDDTAAILTTVWKEYHPIPFALAAGVLIGLNLRWVRRWLAYVPGWVRHLAINPPRPALRPIIGITMFLLVTAAVRGGTLWGEPIRLKHAFVADDLFLNRTVVNPLSSLRYAVDMKLKAERAGGLAAIWPAGGIRSAMRAAGYTPEPGRNSLDDYLKIRAQGHGNPRPKHVFVILMESESGWTVLPSYRDMGFSPEMSRLADEGIYFPHFLPSGDGTANSMNALLTGFADSRLNINYEANSLEPYPTAIAETFRRMGYRTRFFYGGFLSWQRLDSFTQSQGFDEVYGGGSMSTGVSTNEWGVNDRDLFDFVLQTVSEDVPSFNFILNTSNHPPYDLPLDELGFPVKQLPAPLEATKDDTLRVLGHLWYADRQVGRFVDGAAKRLSRPLFAMTGDHTARLRIRFPGDSVFEQYGVPFVLYGPEVLKGIEADTSVAGSHLDIPRTLYELSAPPGFDYYSLGRDLLRPENPDYGLGYDFVIGRQYIATNTETPRFYRLPDTPEDAQPPGNFEPVRQRMNAIRALSWYRVRKGPTLPERPE